MTPEPTEKELRLIEQIACQHRGASEPVFRRAVLAALRAERELAAKWLDEAGEEPGHRFRNTPLRNSAIALRNQEHLP